MSCPRVMDQSTKGIARVTTPATPTVLVAMWRDGFETDRNHNRHNSYCLSGNHRCSPNVAHTTELVPGKVLLR
jgi:hypothetical protein